MGTVKFDHKGLVPAIVQDVHTRQVLMLAYMNEESIQRTLETGDSVFWSRSRQELWHKGDTSGNFQHVVASHLDCDGDTILLEVEPDGPACHTGEVSCFFEPLSAESLPADGEQAPTAAVVDELAQVIASRHAQMPEGSYTAKLFSEGIDRIAKKVGEEATETVIAAKNGAHDEIVWEVADLWYHTLVLLEASGVPVEDVWRELEKRRR
jgi:phosphoribosyl-AMP cyclohydrolase / phosphoribosyl-ATP pyrophosphohydrolase